MDNTMVQQIPWLSIFCMTISIAICFFYPLIIFIYGRKRYGAGVKPVIWGAAVFIGFGLILKSMITYLLFMIPGVKPAISSIPLLSAVTGSLLAGIFEETGRFTAFSLMKRKGGLKNAGTALAYGAGHGGIEAILIVGFAMLNTLFLALTINFTGADALASGLDGETANVFREGVLALSETPGVMFLVSGIERLSAVSFHTAASVIVYYAAARENKRWLLPLAIGLHTLLNIPAGLFQTQVLTNLVFVEVIVFVIAAGVCVFAWRLVKSEGQSPVIE